MADKYWLGRLKKDQALARRAADQVSAEVKRAYRSQYLQTAKNLERLYAEAQSRGTLSRTKLWNYRRWRDMEPKLRQFCEAQGVIQTEKITKALDRVFEDVIGAGVEAFRQDKFLLPYDPRAVIDTAWSGEHYSARVWKNTGELAKRIEAEAQQIVMGDKSLGDVKRQLMRDFDVAWNQADRLVDTEVSYVMNRANLEQYKGYGFRKVEIVNLDVNTCEKCKALEGEVFDIHDAPVVPIHPRCHCSYCVPEEGDEAGITASGANLDEVYERKGVKGYDKPKQYAPKGAKAAAQPIPASKLESKVAEALDAFEKPEVKLEKASKANSQAPAEAIITPNAGGGATIELPGSGASEAVKIPENTAVSDESVLQGSAESGIIETGKNDSAKRFIPGDFKTEAEVRDWIKSPERVLDILPGRQNKHVEGTNEYKQEQAKYAAAGKYGPGRIEISRRAMNALVQKYAGTGVPIIKKGGWTGAEQIKDNDIAIGTVVNDLDGTEAKTTVFKIHYAEKGTHIVPDYPSKLKNGR